MFKDVQNLKVRLWENILQQVETKKKELKADLTQAKKELWQMEYEFHHLSLLDKNALCSFGGKRFSFIERLVSPKARREYREYQNNVNEMNTLPDKIAAMTEKINTLEVETAQQINRSGVLHVIDEIKKTIAEIKAATSLEQLRMKPVEALKMLQDNGIAPVLDESDTVMLQRQRNYKTYRHVKYHVGKGTLHFFAFTLNYKIPINSGNIPCNDISVFNFFNYKRIVRLI